MIIERAIGHDAAGRAVRSVERWLEEWATETSSRIVDGLRGVKHMAPVTVTIGVPEGLDVEAVHDATVRALKRRTDYGQLAAKLGPITFETARAS